VAAELRALGAHVIEADELGRELMEPGQSVYEEIVRVFGPEVVAPDGRLNRGRLAQMAFEGGRLDELNAIVHPAVIRAQQRWMEDVFRRDAKAVAVVESALIFEVERDAKVRGIEPRSQNARDRGHPQRSNPDVSDLLASWRNRFDRVIVLTAPDEVKVRRYVDRVCSDPARREAALADARTRLARQMPDAEKSARADFVIENTGDLAALRGRVVEIWEKLKAESEKTGF